MGPFQKQLVFNDGRTMAEHHNEAKVHLGGIKVAPVGPNLPPVRVSIEDFERDMKGPARDVYGPDWDE